MNRNQEMLSNLKKHLNSNLDNVVNEVILFGSQAKGIGNENSDYDVLLILNRKYNSKDENKILDLCYDIDLRYKIVLDVHILSQKEIDLPRGKQPIFNNAINRGIYA